MSLSTRLAVVGALFAAYLVGFSLLGPAAFGFEHYYWFTALVCVAGFGTVLWTLRRVESVLYPFFALVAVSFAAQALESVSYDRKLFLIGRDTDAPSLDLYMVFSLVFHFSWVCAWGFLCLQLLRQGAATTVARVVLPMSLAIASIFAIDFATDYRSETGLDFASMEVRFDRINEVLQMTGLIFGLTALLLGVRASYAVMNLGYVVLAAGNFLLGPSVAEAAEAIEAVWVLGLVIMWAGVLMVRTQGSSELAGRHPAAEPTSRSGLSALLLLLVLASSLLGTYTGVFFGTDSHLRLAVYLLIAVASVFVMHRIGGRFDRTVDFVRDWSGGLLRNRLEGEHWTECEPTTRRTLERTGLESVLEGVGDAARWLRGQVLFLGPERLFPPAERPSHDRVSSFIVMPFSEPWSDEVDAVIKKACREVGIQPIRGDDIFTPRDILDDIWQAINRADLVVADITGRNANVLYELGIAHTLAKPVLILSHAADDIPIDLATRRVLVYGWDPMAMPRSGDLEQKLREALEKITEDYGLDVKSLRPSF